MIKVYTTTNCPYCHLAKDWLTKHGQQYETINLNEQQDKVEELFKLTGKTAVPVIVIDDAVIVGFQKDQLAEKLGVKIGEKEA